MGDGRQEEIVKNTKLFADTRPLSDFPKTLTILEIIDGQMADPRWRRMFPNHRPIADLTDAELDAARVKAKEALR